MNGLKLIGNKKFTTAFLIVGISIVIVLLNTFHVQRSKYLSGGNIIYKTEDVLGITTDTSDITIDYGTQISFGSPLVFGGAHGPRIAHQDAWDSLQSVGVTFIRRDFYIENELPDSISLNDYKSNKNNVQNPETWNKSNILQTNDIFANAKKRNMKILGILSYVPKWLTYSNTTNGVPKDFDVYKDIVKKLYVLHRDNLDYLEIWNEPNTDQFLNTKGSGLSKETAYKLIFLNAVKAIREVDNEANDGKFVKIGAPALSVPDSPRILDVLLQDQQIRPYLDFISYHNYGNPEPSWNIVKEVMKKYGYENTPVFISEWNYSYNTKIPLDINTGVPGISYTGQKLMNFLKMGVEGANYFSMTFNDTSRPNTVFSTYGFYKRVDEKSILLPQSRTWKLLSNQLKLGTGSSKIFYSTDSQKITSLGFINAENQIGFALSNDTNSQQTVVLYIKNLPLKSTINLIAYEASKNNDASSVVGNNKITGKTGDRTLKIILPPWSTIGAIISTPNNTFPLF